MKVIHTVTARKLKSLQKAGVLKVNTPFFQDKNDEKGYGKPKKDFKNALNMKYICAIPKFRIQSWIKSGFMKEIEFFIKPEYVLEFDIPKNCFKFVREHNYTSPVETKKQFGLDQFMKVPEPHLTKIWNKYIKSNKVFKNLKDLKEIKVPELWISANIPMKNIKITKFSALKRKYNF
ncbi:hypothetical protein CMI47_16640 [Candidatus Pacearchaeota archaeon]|nr:hypothetical protein [Candidatus Pacearchaeota archaeon]|tara:strand:- start:495 stop:1025 length:531 start_codon:yes stop_codon:yes gene_type:complete